MPSHTEEERKKNKKKREEEGKRIREGIARGEVTTSGGGRGPVAPVAPVTEEERKAEVERREEFRETAPPVLQRARQARVPVEAFVGKRGARDIARGEGLRQQVVDRQLKEAGEIDQNLLLAEIAKEEELLEPSTIQKEIEKRGGLGEIETRGERIIDQVAEAGLAIPESIANDLADRIEDISGHRPNILTTQQLLDTKFGKALGITTAAALATMLIASVGPVLVSTGGAITAKLAVSLGVSKGAILTGATLGFATFTGLNQDVIIDKLLDRQEAQELQGAITTIGQMQTDVVGLVKAGGISPARGIAEINRLENDLNMLSHQIQQAVNLDPRVSQSGQVIDIVADIADSRTQLRSARAEILATNQEFDGATITMILADLQSIQKELQGQSATTATTATTQETQTIQTIPAQQLETIPKQSLTLKEAFLTGPLDEQGEPLLIQGAFDLGGRGAIAKGLQVSPGVIAKFGDVLNVPAIFERVAKFPTITKQLLAKGNTKLYDKIGRFTDKGLKALEEFLKRGS